jgi:hypothetical protein
MTWRNTFYLLTVLVALLVVALTTISEASTETTLAAISPQDVLDSLVPTPTNGRLPFLVIGIGAVLLTYRRALLNFTRKS